MEILNDKKLPKLELDYPCSWTYKLVGREKEMIQKAIHEVIADREHSLNDSKKSSGGKYVSMNLDMLITNEEERNFIYEALKAHEHIHYVL